MTEITMPKEFKLPAITFCLRNSISYKKFCHYEPDWCEPPSNIKEFCEKYPYQCLGDTSNLTIPKQVEDTREITQLYLFNESFNAGQFDFSKSKDFRRTFVRDIQNPMVYRYLKCYSKNLHLFQRRWKLRLMKISFNSMEDQVIGTFYINQSEIELFNPKDEPQLYITIHSPYLPVDLLDLHGIKPGKILVISVQLEKEEHLLPPPYKTACRDNGPSRDAEGTRSPNSYQMCVQKCRAEYEIAVDVCNTAYTMFWLPKELCFKEDIDVQPSISPELQSELMKKRQTCVENCKEGCLKLQYKYKIMETDFNFNGTKFNSLSIIHIGIRNPEVTVLKHVPLYGSGEIFSHVGGLLGCWLGISVFTFTNIIEKFFKKVFRRKKIYGIMKQKRAPTSEIHRD